MGSCLSSSNASENTRNQAQNLAHPVPNAGFRTMKNPSQNSQDPSLKKGSSRMNDFQRNNSLTQRGKPALSEEEQRKAESLKHKQLGNNYFKNKNYLLASQEYSKAIEIYNKDSVYYSNRALCFKFLCQFDKVIIDADMSIKLTPTNYKGFHLKGVALVELGRMDFRKSDRINQGIEALNHSLDIVKKQSDKEVIKEISSKLNKAKKMKWLKEKEEAKQKNTKTMAYLNSLISKDQSLSKDDKKDKLALIEEFANEKSHKNKISEVPEVLCCKITFEMIEIPALSPSGVTYENNVIIEHINKTGDFDPCTRQPLKLPDLIQNKTLTKAVLQFQEENPWCYDSGSPDEDFRTVNFN